MRLLYGLKLNVAKKQHYNPIPVFSINMAVLIPLGAADVDFYKHELE
jgi:hypothetical protein